MNKSSVRFAAVGDVSLGDHPLCVGFGAHSTFRRHESTFPYRHIKSFFEGNNLVFGNLECTLSSANCRTTDYDSVQMRGQSDYIGGVADAGFDVMNLANNHALQHGKEAFIETVDLLSLHNIRTTGVNYDDHLVGSPTIVKRNGLSIGFLGYSLRPRQYFEYSPLYTEGHKEGIISDIKSIREKVDIVIISVHWGEEFIQRPAPNEIQLGRQMIDAGSDLIIGHHPHVLRGVEKYKDRYIAYSLGNFVCDMVWDDTLRETAILQCELRKDGIHDMQLVPCYINDHFQPEALQGKKAEFLLNKVSLLSRDIENVSLSDINPQSSIYFEEADDVRRVIRKKAQMFFLHRFWKCSPLILIQQILRFFLNRVHELLDRYKRQ